MSLKTKTVTLLENVCSINMIKCTVIKAAESYGITKGSEETTEITAESKFNQNNTDEIHAGVNVTVLVDGKVLNIQSSEKNVESMLGKEGIVINSQDRVLPDLKIELSEGLVIEIIRVETKITSENVAINYKEIIKSDKKLPNTKRQTIQEGKLGEKVVTSCKTYENGKLVSSRIIGERIVKKPIDKIVVQGAYPLMPVSRGGNVMPYGKVFRAKATAY